MNGLELSEKFYLSCGKAMIREKFPEYEERIAVGLAGQGSDCAGFDDEASRDHDFRAGFCLWLTEDDEEKIGFPLSRAYSKLPRSFEGVSVKQESYCQNDKFGVMSTGDFFRRQLGRDTLPASAFEWFRLPEHALFTATNGKVFRDDLGEFSDFRDALKNRYPEDVRNKKLAAHLALAAQAGQYNYSRCLKHGEPGAAALSLSLFADHLLFILFELSKEFTPFYKWRFRAAKLLPEFHGTAVRLEALLTDSSLSVPKKREMIEMTAAEITGALCDRGLSSLPGEYYLEAQAMQVQKTIRDPELSSLHLMEDGE